MPPPPAPIIATKPFMNATFNTQPQTPDIPAPPAPPTPTSLIVTSLTTASVAQSALVNGGGTSEADYTSLSLGRKNSNSHYSNSSGYSSQNTTPACSEDTIASHGKFCICSVF